MGVSPLLTTNWYAPPSKEIVGLLHFAQVLMLYPFVHLEHRVPREAQWALSREWRSSAETNCWWSGLVQKWYLPGDGNFNTLGRLYLKMGPIKTKIMTIGDFEHGGFPIAMATPEDPCMEYLPTLTPKVI